MIKKNKMHYGNGKIVIIILIRDRVLTEPIRTWPKSSNNVLYLISYFARYLNVHIH